MRVLFDNGTPRGVAAALKDHVVEEVRAHGWDTLDITPSIAGMDTAPAAQRNGGKIFFASVKVGSTVERVRDATSG